MRSLYDSVTIKEEFKEFSRQITFAKREEELLGTVKWWFIKMLLINLDVQLAQFTLSDESFKPTSQGSMRILCINSPKSAIGRAV